MTAEEHETFANWNYSEGKLILYTTKKSVFDQWKRRVAKFDGVEVVKGELALKIPLRYARSPALVLRAKPPALKRAKS